MVKFDYKNDVDAIFNSEEPPFKEMVDKTVDKILKYILKYDKDVDQEFVKKEVSGEFVFQLRKFVDLAISNRKNKINDLSKFVMRVAYFKKTWITDVCKGIITTKLKLFDPPSSQE